MQLQLHRWHLSRHECRAGAAQSHFQSILLSCEKYPSFQERQPRLWKGAVRTSIYLSRGALPVQGVATMVLESPFYGARRPAEQRGAKLLHVSDLLTLGRSTIEESLFLLSWAQKQGLTQLGGRLSLDQSRHCYPGHRVRGSPGWLCKSPSLLPQPQKQ